RKCRVPSLTESSQTRSIRSAPRTCFIARYPSRCPIQTVGIPSGVVITELLCIARRSGSRWASIIPCIPVTQTYPLRPVVRKESTRETADGKSRGVTPTPKILTLLSNDSGVLGEDNIVVRPVCKHQRV